MNLIFHIFYCSFNWLERSVRYFASVESNNGRIYKYILYLYYNHGYVEGWISILFLTSLDKNSRITFERIVNWSDPTKDLGSASPPGSVLRPYWNLPMMVPFGQSHVISEGRWFLIGCSTKVEACARPHSWWKADIMADIPAGNVSFGSTAKSQKQGNDTSKRLFMNPSQALWLFNGRGGATEKKREGRRGCYLLGSHVCFPEVSWPVGLFNPACQKVVQNCPNQILS